jgi:hypothetical protein
MTDVNLYYILDRLEEILDDMRVMPAAGVADILYEALDEIKRYRGIEE